MSERRAFFERYGLAFAAVLITAVARYYAQPLFANRLGLIGFILPVVLAARYGGLGPGLFATALSFAIGVFALVPPAGFAIASTADAAIAVTFAITGVVVTTQAADLRGGRERAEDHARRAERLQAVAAALSGELTAKNAAEAVLREGLQALGAGKGVIATLDPNGTTLSIIASTGFETDRWGVWEHFAVDGPYPVSEAVRLKEPLFIDSGEELKRRFPTLLETIHEGGSAVVVPLLDQAGPVGGLYYRFDDLRSFGPENRDYLLALGRLGAGALARARLHDGEHRATERSVFLAKAGAVLAGSLDFEATVRQVAELAVPVLAEYCTVHVREADGSIRTLALAGEPARIAAARRFLEVAPPKLDDQGGVGQVIREGQTLIVPFINEEMLRASLSDPVIRDAAIALDAHSHMAVPLTIHGQHLGALALTTTSTSMREFTSEDRTLAEELAARAALAIENSRLYTALAAREAQQAAVARLGQLALAERELQPVFDATAAELTSVLGVELAKILELQPDGRELRLVGGAGWRPGLVGTATELTGLESQAGYTLESSEPVVVDDLVTETRFHRPKLLADHGAISGITAIIRGANGPWGVLGVHTTRPRVFTRDDTNFLVAVTNVLAGAIERRRTSDEERQAQDVNRAFIGIVSHELRTPITTIYGGAKILARLAPTDPQRDVIAADVEADADRLYRLTEDLLVMTRLERHDLEITREPVLLTRLIERVVSSERRRWPLVEMKVSIPTDLQPVGGEDNYVEQVVRNLVTNAAKYSPAGSSVEIVAERRGDEAMIRVLDRGPGIRDEDLKQLFSLFYRAPSTAQQASGAGIGLFVCDQLVRAMGGRLWARRRPGGGSEFGFALLNCDEEDQSPIAPTDAKPLVTDSSARSSIASRGTSEAA